eukprot:1160325-Pelagomonas_calceolata.AAC.13
MNSPRLEKRKGGRGSGEGEDGLNFKLKSLLIQTGALHRHAWSLLACVVAYREKEKSDSQFVSMKGD